MAFDSHSEEERDKELAETGKGKRAKKGKAKAERTRGRGRQDADKQPAVKKPKVIAERLDELVELTHKAKAACERRDDAITKAGEDSGYLAGPVKKLVNAKASERYEEKHREVEQQKELFDECE